MKLNKEKIELRALDLDGIRKKLMELRRDMFVLRLNATTSGVKDISQFKKLRRSIARTISVAHEKMAIAQIQMLQDMIANSFRNQEVAESANPISVKD